MSAAKAILFNLISGTNLSLYKN